MRTIKLYSASGGMTPYILNLDARWRWVVNLSPWEQSPSTHRIGGWLLPRASWMF
jgi:hypothetical protein